MTLDNVRVRGTIRSGGTKGAAAIVIARESPTLLFGGSPTRGHPDCVRPLAYDLSASATLTREMPGPGSPPGSPPPGSPGQPSVSLFRVSPARSHQNSDPPLT